jgi:Fructose/tagatose bisphosphate aldolase
MSVITGRKNVEAEYSSAAQRGWVIPCFCSENLTTTEAIFSAASDFAAEHGLISVPVTIAMTIRYSHRPQATFYTRTGRWDTGLRLFRADIGVLADAFPNVNTLVHLDHVQYDLDHELLEWDLSDFSSIMYDASAAAFERNIEYTAAYVARMGKNIIIEGACDEIMDATGDKHNDITDPAAAERYIKQTGADMIVANLGTEHRASGKELTYHGDAARAIKAKIGTKTVLHGASSVPDTQISNLFDDGICKVNIWTAIERDSMPDMLDFLVKNASKAAGGEKVASLIKEGYLTEKCADGGHPSLSAFTQAAAGKPVFEKMRSIVRSYLELWYKL